MKGKFLINTDDYFVAPDGLQYRAVWGDCETVPAKEALGFDPNRNSANWFVKVGASTDYVLIAGCQIHYATACPDRPNTDGTTQDFGEGAKDRSSYIYIPENRINEVDKFVDMIKHSNDVPETIWRPEGLDSRDFMLLFYQSNPSICDQILNPVIKETVSKMIYRAERGLDIKNIESIYLQKDKFIRIYLENDFPLMSELK